MTEQVKIADSAAIVALCEKTQQTGVNLENSFAGLQKRVRESESRAAAYCVEMIDLRDLLSFIRSAIGNLCNESAFAHFSDGELRIKMRDKSIGENAAHLLEAREAYAEYLAHNKPEPAEITSDDFEPVENWRPERDV